jgi:hypothetical protein
LNHLHHHLALSFGHPYGPFSQASGNGFRCEARAPFTFLRLKISKSPDRLPGDIDTNILRRPVRVADQGCHATGVEDAIKITTGGLRCVGELDVVVLPHPLPRVRAGRGDEQQPVGAVE